MPLTSSVLFQISGLLDAQKLPFCNKQIHKYDKRVRYSRISYSASTLV